MKAYYENVMVLEELRVLSAPTEADLKKVLDIIKDDVELALYFYDELDPGWIELLDKAGEFEDLREKEVGMIGKYKAHYFKKCAETKADYVLGIIGKIDAQDINIQGTLIRAIAEMPKKTAITGIGVVREYLAEQEKKWWYAIGESASELMVNIIANHPDKAFEVAETLLEAWVSEEEVYGKDIVAKFSQDEYSKLMLEHYRKVWEAEPERAVGVLIKILDRCLESMDEKEDASRSFGYGLELGDLDEIDMKHPAIRTILVKGICEAGRVLIDEEQGKVSDFLDLLEGTNKVIFLRIAMYLLRFVKPGTEKERISKFAGNKEYFKEYNPCWNEHRRLLNDKFDEVSDKAKVTFIDWVKTPKITEERKKEVTEWCEKNKEPLPDFEKWENQAKAEELYLARDRFRNLYEEYKKNSGVSDAALAPRSMVSETRRVGPTEGSPLSVEEMVSMEAGEVLAYLNDPSKWKIDKGGASPFHTPEEGLAGTFEKVVQQGVRDYSKLGRDELIKLKPTFLKRYFHGAWNALREDKVEEKSLVNFLERANYVIDEQSGNQDYEGVFTSIVYVVEGIFEDEHLKKKLIRENGEAIWKIIESLARYEEKEDLTDYDGDPHQGCINCVQGKAFSLVVRFGLSWKNRDSKSYERNWSQKIVEVLQYVIENVDDPRVKSVLGVWFPQLHWLEKEWVEGKLDNIFDIVDEKSWDVVWGSYMSWGRAYENVFGLLVEHGKYDYALEKIESGMYRKHDKDPDEGLVEHLMIGYFNGWVDIDDELMKKFFEKATAKLKGKAARFLTTGFKPANEEGGTRRDKVAARMRNYWNNRLAAIKDNPEENKDEAIEFAGWVEDSLLERRETLELLERTLTLSGGRIGEMRDAQNFVERVSKLGKGNELLALSCLREAAKDKNMHMPWAHIQDPLVEFLETMVESPENVLSEAIEVADLYGRYNPEKFREVWERLKKRVEGE